MAIFRHLESTQIACTKCQFIEDDNCENFSTDDKKRRVVINIFGAIRHV